jgi:hypothetical protein
MREVPYTHLLDALDDRGSCLPCCSRQKIEVGGPDAALGEALDAAPGRLHRAGAPRPAVAALVIVLSSSWGEQVFSLTYAALAKA